MQITGLKLSILAVTTGSLESMLYSVSNVWAQLGVAGLALLGLIYIYCDMRKVHKEKELKQIQHTEEIKNIMNSHKDDIRDIIKEQAVASAAIAKIASDAASRSSEILRDNVQIMIEVKQVIKANTDAIVWCRDSAIARAKKDS